MSPSAQEWFEQARYDLETGRYMLEGGRNFYAVFMAHLAVEKSLKGALVRKSGSQPPRSHNLLMLLSLTGLVAPEDTGRFLARLSQASVVTRYPEELAQLRAAFDTETTREMLRGAQEVLEWLSTTSQ